MENQTLNDKPCPKSRCSGTLRQIGDHYICTACKLQIPDFQSYETILQVETNKS